jgi:hypothetical protein
MDSELRAIIIATLVVFVGIPVLYCLGDVVRGDPIGTTMQSIHDKQYQ